MQHTPVAQLALLVLSLTPACDPASKPPPLGGVNRADADAPAATAGDSGSDASGPLHVDPVDAGAVAVSDSAADVGTPQPIIGYIDADSVTLVQAEAAAPVLPVCASENLGSLRPAASLPSDAIALSVTPDGERWMYARPALAPSDAAAADAAFDAAAPDPDQTLGVHDADFHLFIDTAEDSLEVLLPDDQDARLGAALSVDGEQLVTTKADRTGFLLWELNAGAHAYEPAPSQPFVRLNALATQGGVRFERPVFSTSGMRLYVQETHPGSNPIQLVLRDGQWETEVRLTAQHLLPNGVVVTAASVDDLTLIGWSEANKAGVALWRPRADEPVSASLSVTGSPVFAVSHDCHAWWSL